MDPLTLSTAAAALGAVKNVSDLGQALAKRVQKVKNREVRREVDDMLVGLTTVRAAVDRVAQENSDLRSENDDLKRRLKQRDEYEFKDAAYWRKLDDGSTDPVPRCPKCMHGKQPQTVPMRHDAEDQNYHCVVCGYDTNADTDGKKWLDTMKSLSPSGAGVIQSVPIRRDRFDF